MASIDHMPPRLIQTLIPSTPILLIALLSAARLPAQNKMAEPRPWIAATDQAVHALCGKKVALLGESPTHAFGNTLDFKAQLVRRLVDECHYNALFVESGFYDYINIDRERKAGNDVPDSTIAAAIGGLWANEEVQALIPFLSEKVKAGSLTLGGLDDQIGAGTYASREMPSDLVEYLDQKEKPRCLAIFQRHMLWQYTESAPYGPSDKQKIVGCLNELETQLSSAKQSAKSIEEARAMVNSLQRNFTRNFTEDDFTKKEQELKWIDDRDRSMYLNFKWLLGRLQPQSKIIVWAATVHTAKNLDAIEGFAGRTPFGSYIETDFKDQAFSLGFSAFSGDYAFTHQPVRRLADAPLGSLEGQTFAHSDSDAVYLSGKQLRAHNSARARLLGTDFKSAHWDQVVDGLVIFKQERSPSWIKRQ